LYKSDLGDAFLRTSITTSEVEMEEAHLMEVDLAQTMIHLGLKILLHRILLHRILLHRMPVTKTWMETVIISWTEGKIKIKIVLLA